MKRIFKGLSFLLLCATSGVFAATHEVNCDDNNQSLATAVMMAEAGDEIRVSGTCSEAVMIKTDDLTIDGQGTAIIDGSNLPAPGHSVAVKGARGVQIIGLTVQQGDTGIFVSAGGHVSLEDVKVNDSGLLGIHAAEKSVLSMDGVDVMNTFSNGINITEASNLKVTGPLNVSGSGVFSLNLQDGSVLTADGVTIDLSDNVFGLHISVGATAFVNESTIVANNNRFIGAAIDNGSKLFLFSSDLTTNNNGLDGIDCNINSNLDADASSTITANGNGRNGISLEDTTFNTFSFFITPGPIIEASHNGQNGVILTLGSKFDIGINSQLVVKNNGTNGLLADDGSTAILTDTTIRGHRPGPDDQGADRKIGDLRVTFGSRVSAVGNTKVKRIVCDESALLRGGLSCKHLVAID